MSVNALEAIRFYVSFACSFAFAERELMEGNAKIIRLIARDEALHLTGTQHILNLMRTGQDDPEMVAVAQECEAECFELFKRAAEQEKAWAEYLFKDGSMIGLNKDILAQYIEYITHLRMGAVGLALHLIASSLTAWGMALTTTSGKALIVAGFQGDMPFFSQHAGYIWLYGLILVQVVLLILPARWFVIPTHSESRA